MKQYNQFLALIICIVVLSSFVQSRSYRVNQLPNGNVFGCANCHISAGGGGALNDFGGQVSSGYLSSGNVVWNNTLATMDSDGDGFSNGFELGDPDGNWTSDASNPGSPNNVTNPGDPSSLAVAVQINMPDQFNLKQNYPNPFNPLTKIQFSISNDTQLKLIVFDLMGNEVKTIINEFLPMGTYVATWDGTNNNGYSQSGGIYFYKLQARDFVQIKKMTYVK